MTASSSLNNVPWGSGNSFAFRRREIRPSNTSAEHVSVWGGNISLQQGVGQPRTAPHPQPWGAVVPTVQHHANLLVGCSISGDKNQ